MNCGTSDSVLMTFWILLSSSSTACRAWSPTWRWSACCPRRSWASWLPLCHRHSCCCCCLMAKSVERVRLRFAPLAVACELGAVSLLVAAAAVVACLAMLTCFWNSPKQNSIGYVQRLWEGDFRLQLGQHKEAFEQLHDQPNIQRALSLRASQGSNDPIQSINRILSIFHRHRSIYC